MERQEGHQEVVQRVRRGAWREVERERMELKEAGERIGSKTWFLASPRLTGEVDMRRRVDAKG